jgi:putative Mg2+ transporter-C (MgtC) family protein
MEHFIITDIDMVIRPVLAMLLGSLLGVERLFAGKTAGMRTYSLVSLGATIFVMVGLIVTGWYVEVGYASFDPMRMASQIVVGVGFLGAGLIIFRNDKISGLTTAAGLWLAAGVGISVGFGLFEIAIVATLLTLFIFSALGYVKNKLEKISSIEFPDPHRSTDHDDEV